MWSVLTLLSYIATNFPLESLQRVLLHSIQELDIERSRDKYSEPTPRCEKPSGNEPRGNAIDCVEKIVPRSAFISSIAGQVSRSATPSPNFTACSYLLFIYPSALLQLSFQFTHPLILRFLQVAQVRQPESKKLHHMGDVPCVR